MTNRLCKTQILFRIMIFLCFLQQKVKFNHTFPVNRTRRPLGNRGPCFDNHWSSIIPYTDIRHFIDRWHLYWTISSNFVLSHISANVNCPLCLFHNNSNCYTSKFEVKIQNLTFWYTMKEQTQVPQFTDFFFFPLKNKRKLLQFMKYSFFNDNLLLF